jgi:parallel beta-helix repeat protein
MTLSKKSNWIFPASCILVVAIFSAILISSPHVTFHDENTGFDGQEFHHGDHVISSYDRSGLIVINGEPNTYSTYASNGSGTELDPWIIENKLIETNGTGSGIFIQGQTDYAIIRDCYINETSGLLQACIQVMNSDNILFDNNTLENGDILHALIGTDNVNISNSYTFDGIDFFEGIDNTYIDNSTFEANSNAQAFKIANDNYGWSSENVTITNTTFNCSDDITVLGEISCVTNLVINNCSFSEGKIQLRLGFYDDVNDALVNDSMFDLADQEAIELRGCNNTNITYCNITGAGEDAIDFHASESNTYVEVSNCKIENCTGYALNPYRTTGSNNVIIEDNWINDTDGIYFYDYDNSIIRGNTILENNNSYPIGVYGVNENVTIDNNYIENSGGVNGIYIGHSSGNNYTIDNNTLVDTKGIYIKDLSNSSISLNNISSSGNYGIYLQDSENLTILSNEVNHCMNGLHFDNYLY